MVFPYLETAISFALVMLVASLMVNVVVRILYTLRGQRAEGVQNMLRQLHSGFCDERDIPLFGDARTQAQQAFLRDVLGSPILHDGARWAVATAAYDKGMAAAMDAWKKAGLSATRSKDTLLADPVAGKLAAQAKALEDKAKADRADYVAARIDFINQGDLLAIIRSCSTDTGVDDARILPSAWFGGLAPMSRPPTFAQQRQFAYDYVSAGAVNARDFHDYCQRWFSTVETNASAAFGLEQRGIARSVAGIAVVLLNLDAIHLAYDLYQNRTVSDQLSGRVDDVLALSKQIGSDKPDAPMSVSAQELSKAAAILTTEHVPIGWHDSYIAKRWCAYHDDCDDPTITKPTKGALELDLLMWLFGLGTSWMLLSLGAPFWVAVIEKVTGLANLTSGGTSDEHKGEERAWTVEGAGDQTSYDPAASSAGLPRQQPVTGQLGAPATNAPPAAAATVAVAVDATTQAPDKT